MTYLGFKCSIKGKRAHLLHRLQKARIAGRLTSYYLSRLKYLPIKHKLTIAKACVDATYLYGIEVAAEADRRHITKQMDIVRRRVLRRAIGIPRHMANEIIQLDVGWQRIDTIVAVRQIRMLNRIQNLNGDPLVAQVLRAAQMQNIPLIQEIRANIDQVCSNEEA